LQNAVILHGSAEASFEVRTEQTLSGTAGNEIDRLDVASRFGGHTDRNAIVPAADTEVAILHDDGERFARSMESLAGATEPPDCTEQLQLIDVALFGSVHFGEVVKHLVGEFDVGHTFQHAPEDGPRLIAVSSATRQHPTEKLGANHNVALAV